LVKVHIHSRLATTELYRRLRDFELEAAIVHAVPDEARDVELMPLYEERYVLIAPSDMLPAATSTVRWPDAAQLPLALLTQDMRGRQILDEAFAEHGITMSPQVETDSVASMLAQVATGRWACIVPHTWLWTSLMAGDIRVFELVDPVLTAQVAVAINSAGPGSPVARAFSATAQKLNLNQFFDARLLGIIGRR
jgi:DNA-binding transcriptional LysR family regulator